MDLQQSNHVAMSLSALQSTQPGSVTNIRLMKERLALNNFWAENERNVGRTEKEKGELRHAGCAQFTEIEHQLKSGYQVLKALEDLVEEGKEDCDNLFVDNNLYSSMHKEGVIEQIKGAVNPPYSFEPETWRIEYEGVCK